MYSAMFKIINKYKYFISMGLAVVTFLYLNNYDDNVESFDTNLIILSFNSDYSQRSKISSLLEEVSSIGEIIENVYFEDAIEYRREVFLKTLNEYDFNLWKKIYSSSSFKTFIDNISHIIERTYISRYDHSSIKLVDLQLILKRLSSFITIQDKILFNDFEDGDLLLNSILFDDILYDFNPDINHAFIQLRTPSINGIDSLVINIKSAFKRNNIKCDIYRPEDFRKAINMHYQSFENLNEYEDFYSKLSKSSKIQKIYSFLNYYNANSNHDRFQFINKMKAVQFQNSNQKDYLNSLEILEEKIIELNLRFQDHSKIYTLTNNLLFNEGYENQPSLTELIIKLNDGDKNHLRYNKLNDVFLSSLTKLIKDSKNMTQLDMQTIPSYILKFYINHNHYMLRYY